MPEPLNQQNHPHPNPLPAYRERELSHLNPIAFLALLAACASVASYYAAGPTLGLFFAGFFVATILAPAAVLTQPRLSWKIISIATITIAIALVWLAAVVKTPDTFSQWCAISIELFAYASLVGAIATVLTRFHFDASIALAISVILGLLWLTWPVWLSTTLADTSAYKTTGILVKLHPPLVANGVLINESPWTEKTLAYGLTNLNQDMPIQLPQSAFVSILAHGLTAIGLLALSRRPQDSDEIAKVTEPV